MTKNKTKRKSALILNKRGTYNNKEVKIISMNSWSAVIEHGLCREIIHNVNQLTYV